MEQTPMPHKNTGIGPLIGTSIIIVLLIIGTLHFWQVHLARIAAIRAANAAAAAAAAAVQQ